MSAAVSLQIEKSRERAAAQKARLQALRDEARQRYAGGAPGLQVAALICEMVDGLIVELFEESLREVDAQTRRLIAERSAIVAVGGTGRGELAPYSDADLLFLHAPGCPARFAECVAQAVRDFWDAGIRLGHSVRTPRDALAAARVDPQFATALVEARRIWGDERQFESFKSKFFRRVVRNRYAAFFHACESTRAAERSQFGATERQLEPDVKRSPGGLRDIHLIRWIGYAKYGTTEIDLLRLAGALSREDARALVAAQEFLTQVRVDLHFSAGKAQEVLTREEQLRLAELHGIEATAGQRPVERFMQTYFRHSTAIVDIARRFVARNRPRSWWTQVVHALLSHRSNETFRVTAGEIDVVPAHRDRVCGNYEQVLHLFELAGLYSVDVSTDLAEQIREAAPKWNREITPEAARLFLSILGTVGHAGRILRGLYACGALEVVLPEMGHSRGLLQFNQYHSYTVDEHSLRAVEAAERFEADPGPLGVAYRAIRHKDILHLALLLHDLGKGYEEDHSDVGRRIAESVALRLGLPGPHAASLVFLVHKHLLMAHLALRRDLSDAAMLARFARNVGSPELLRMLYVLTAADITAVGPSAWTSWKAELLTELFERTMPILAGVDPKFRQAERLRQVREQVRQALEETCGTAVATALEEPRDGQRLDDELAAFPPHYLSATPPAQIVRDLATLRELGERPAIVEGRYDPGTGTVDYRVVSRDVVGSGLFSKITGVLTAKGLAILSANICTTSAGLVVDSFRVVDGDHAGDVPAFRLHEVSMTIEEVLAGRMSVEGLFERNKRFVRRTESLVLFREPTRVVIDNDSSDAFTIVDVFAHDRRGLLYVIATALFDLRLSVSLAKIATHLDQALDVFYVTDREGGKLQDTERLQQIHDTLLARVDEFVHRGPTARGA